MLNILKVLDRPIMVNGVICADSDDALESFGSFTGELEIVINFPEPVAKRPGPGPAPVVVPPSMAAKLLQITVRQYMTRPSSPEFDFHRKFNGDVPMPWRTMVGEVVDERGKMVKMRLRGFILGVPVNTCMVCDRALTNPISFLTGIGPECSGRGHIPVIKTPDALLEQWVALRDKVAEVTWEGWIPKSAIEWQEEISREELEKAPDVAAMQAAYLEGVAKRKEKAGE